MGLREQRKKEQAARKRFEMTKILGIAACVLVAAGAIGYLIHYNWSLKQQEKQYEELRQTEVVESVYSEETQVTEAPEESYCEQLYDFEELRGENKDIYAWITVPGTQVDYPVLQSETDNYYLDRNLDDSTGYPGCIYTNKINKKDFSDYNTVLYGHNMKNGSMFGCLHEFEDGAFFEENRTIVVYTEEKRLTYEICAAVKFTDVYIPAYYDASTEIGRDAFISDLKKESEGSSVSHIREGVELLPEDKLITLSTRVNGERPKRYIVVGKLVEEAVYEESGAADTQSETGK